MLKNQKIWYWVKIVFGLLWLSRMLHSKAYASVYVLIAAAGLYCIRWNYVNHPKAPEGWRKLLLAVFAGLFSFCSVLANYELYYAFRLEFGSISLVGGFLFMWEILLYACCHIPLKTQAWEKQTSPTRVFFTAFAIMAAIDLFFLFVLEYPGTLTPDSISQMNQLMSGSYSNHHPYWHTVVIKLFVNLGMALFGDINHGVAVYCVFQILFMTASFAYVIVTLYQIHVPRKVVLTILALYALTPHHIYFSFTIWKDVLFAGAILLFVTALYRILRSVGEHSWSNYVVFVVGAMGFALWRNNGGLASMLALLCSLPVLFKRNRKVLLIWLAVLLLGNAMKVPYLASIGAEQTDVVELLSIPLQQVARVIKEGGNLTAEEYELLEQIVDVEEIPSVYKDYISDPIKTAVRAKNPAYFQENLSQYLKLWVQLGRQYPGLYLFAWVDQTKGYWNSGYRYVTIMNEIYKNDLGLHKAFGRDDIRWKAAQWFFGMSVHGAPELGILSSIGFHDWLLAFALLMCLLQKKREAILALPALMVVFSLLIGTPVYNELRYAYSVFTTLPLVMAVAVYDIPDNRIGDQEGL